MTTPPHISIIIPVRDHTDYLTTLLQGIREHGPCDIPYEIIVVDDGSRDHLAPLAQQYGALFLREEKSGGPAHARNIGAAKASGDLLFFLDADLEYAPGLLDRATSLLKTHPELAAISFIDKPYHPEDGMIKNYGALIEYYYYQKLVDGESMKAISAFTTRNGVVRASAFQEIGGFDEHYTTNAMEDYDFGKRLAARFPVAMSNGPLLYHNFPHSLLRMLRNYWVRTRLFVPFYLDKRPILDKAMTSKSEAMVRFIGFIGACFAVATIPATSMLGAYAGSILFILGLLCFLAYIVLIREFLALAKKHSHSMFFVLQCVIVHGLSSLVIVVAGYWGLGIYLFSRLFMTGETSDSFLCERGPNTKK